MRRDDSDRLFDKRVFRRNISAGRISKDDHRRFLEALPDVEDKIKPAEEGGDDDGWDGTPAHERSEIHRPLAPAFAASLGARPDFGSDDDDDEDDDDDFDDEDDDDDDDDDPPVEEPPVEEPPPTGGDGGGL